MAIKETNWTSRNQTVIDPGAEQHDPRLYETDTLANPVDGLENITDEHIDFYQQEGYLAVENALTSDELADARDGLMHLIDGKNPDFSRIMWEAGAKDRLDELSGEERLDAVRKLFHFVDFDARLQAAAENPRLMAVLERLLGEPPKLIQDMALIKPPRHGREKPWHQDKAYFDFPLASRVVGVWIALDPATLENGCMRVQPQGHQQGPVIHFKRRDWQICDTQIMGKPCIAAPLKPGGLLLFDGLLPHGTPTNHSTSRRRALQYHYAGLSATKTNMEERLAHFGNEGKDVTC